jgi:hypothetical protein
MNTAVNYSEFQKPPKNSSSHHIESGWTGGEVVTMTREEYIWRILIH